MGGGWKRPDLPEGALKNLNDELHELHGLSGHRTTREIERWLKREYGDEAPSHTKVHQVFTRPRLSNPELLLRIVRQLALRIRSVNEEDECDRFDALWLAAREEELNQQRRRREQPGSSCPASDDLSAITPPQLQVERLSTPSQILNRGELVDQIEARDPTLPDPQASRAVFAGNDPRGLGPGPACVVAEQLCGLLRHPSGTFLNQNTVASIEPTKDQLLMQLQEAADHAEDTLLFYYAGRSRVSRNGLLLRVSEIKQQGGLFVNYEAIRGIVSGSRARRKVVILECSSHAGQVLEAVGPVQREDGHTVAANPSTYVIVARRPLAEAADDSPSLPFTETLMEILRDGIRGAPELLTVDTIVREIRRKARELEFPEPKFLIRNDRRLALARNPEYPQVTTISAR